MNFFDLHCDTLLNCMLDKNCRLHSNAGHISLEKMKNGSVSAQCFAIFVPVHDTAEEYGIKLSPYEYFKETLKLYKKEMAENIGLIRPALCAGDILNNSKEGCLSSVLTIEDLTLVDSKAERLKEFYDDGVRMASLTWNYVNCIGHPNSPEQPKHALGLTEFGRESLSIMNELGMIIDVSHLSEGGFYDVAESSKKPFAASHSCARALCGHPRNLSDAQLRTLADCGGIVGVSFVPSFLRPGSEYGTAKDVLRHILYIVNIAGIEAVAIGSDFDGFTAKSELSDCTKLPMLAELIGRELGEDNAEKICFGNALRLFREVCG